MRNMKFGFMKRALVALRASSSVSERAAEDACSMARRCGFNEFEQWLTCGGDDRSLILDTGANKYHIKPQPINESKDIFRGSCTGNPPTGRGYEAAKSLFEGKLQGLQGDELDSVLRDIFHNQRERLAQCLRLPEGTEVILCPSGSDAEYFPIAMSRALHPTKKITNGVTQLNEIGAGSAPASEGKYFSTHAPFLGKNDLMHLSGFENIDTFVVSARTNDGNIINASEKMEIFQKEALSEGKYPIVHGVFGGKTGVRDQVMPASLQEGETCLGVVDACQGRFSLDELHQWLEQDSVVLFTSSKFFQAPPFCGAVIVPASIAKKLSAAKPPTDMLLTNGLGAFVTDKELPSCLKSWKGDLQDERKNNVGLALRWEAGLSAMEALSPLSDEQRTALSNEWASSVKNFVDANEFLDIFCIERTIVSIKIAKEGGGWLSMKEARDLYRWMASDISESIDAATDEEKTVLKKLAYTGQPVSVSESYAIVRIALGVESMLSYFEKKEETLKEDMVAVRKLGLIAKYFETLKSSGI